MATATFTIPDFHRIDSAHAGRTKTVATAMTAMATEMAELHQEVATNREETEKLRRFIDNRLEERDRKLMEILRMIQENAQRETATSQEQKKRRWWPFQ
jgi:hypothetical protein